jgi:hypothetical protein
MNTDFEGRQPMIRKRVNSFTLRLRYLILLVGIYSLMGLNGFKRKLEVSKTRTEFPQEDHFPNPVTC